MQTKKVGNPSIAWSQNQRYRIFGFKYILQFTNIITTDTISNHFMLPPIAWGARFLWYNEGVVKCVYLSICLFVCLWMSLNEALAFHIRINSGVCTIALASGSTLGPLVPSILQCSLALFSTQRRHAQLQVQSGGRQEKLRLGGSVPRPGGGLRHRSYCWWFRNPIPNRLGWC